MTMRACLGAAALLALAACGPIVQVGGNAKPPPALLSLSADAPPRPAAETMAPVDRAQALGVLQPLVPGALQTLRIPVIVSDTEIQYIKGGQWAEQPSRLFRRLVADRLAGAGVPVVEPSVAGGSGGRQLSGQLAAFGVDLRSGAPVASVRYDATLVAADGLRQRQFAEEEPLGAVAPAPAAAALNRAANRLAGRLAEWVAQAGPAAPAPPASAAAPAPPPAPDPAH